MNKLLILVALLLGSLAVIPSNKSASVDDVWLPSDSIKHLSPDKKYINETKIINELLTRYHYRKLEVNDSLSSVILNNYLTSLDYNRTFFLKKDVEGFEKYRYTLDDAIRNGNLEPAFEIYNLFQDRFFERMTYLDSALEKGFDFSKDETFETDRENADWSETAEVLDEVWRKSLKNQALNLTLAGKEIDESIEVLEKRYTRYRTIIAQYKPSDVYQIFMNAYTESFDPHTGYMNPFNAESFDIEMSRSLEGIGARLSKDGDYTVVVDIIAGGPAFRSNELHKDDKIIGVGQGDDEEIVDVVGWRNDDVVKLIRGKKGTVVRLLVLKAVHGASATPEIVRLVRDKVNIEDQRASSKVYNIERDGKNYALGVITVPDFYKSFSDARNGSDYNSVTKDVKKLLESLNADGIDGLLIDLRRNGGGALDEAIELTGLFIKNGPVVQVRDRGDEVEVGADELNDVVYDGPLTVLINRSSASASEIFAGAIQDYKRGVVLGETSYGKGSVQRLIDLNNVVRFPDKENKMGNLKLTLAKYYRITGSSTQNVGVSPDVALPSAFDPETFGESSMPAALPWDKIEAAEYEETAFVSDDLLDALNKEYIKDLNEDQELRNLVADLERAKARRNQTNISLNEAARQMELDQAKAEEEARKNHSKVLNENESFSIEGEPSTAPVIDDTYLKESLRLLATMVDRQVG